MRTTSLLAFLVVAALPAFTPVGAAEESQGEKGKIRWSLSGEARFRPEWRDNADLDSAADDDTRLGLMRIRLGFSVEAGDRLRLFVQAQDSRVAGDETSTTSNESNLDLHQGYVDVTPVSGGSITIRAGRQELRYGDERMIGAFGWDNVGRAFDGVKLTHARGRFSLDAFAAQVSNTMTGAATEGSDLYGVYTRTSAREKAQYEGYLLSYVDHVDVPGETGDPGETRVNALGGRAQDRYGRFDFRVEAVIESGEVAGDDLSAWAAAGQAGITWGEKAPLRAFAGYDFATGDEDSVDGEREEFFNFYPTNHPHYGFMDYEGWRNISSPYVGVSITRGRHFGQAKAHRFRLDESTGAWKSAGGAVLGLDPTGSSGSNVGTEYDITYRFSWLEKTTIEAGLSRFEPGRFARLTRGDDPSHWAYLMFTWGF